MIASNLLCVLATISRTWAQSNYSSSTTACTSTITHRPSGCCLPQAAHTTTSYTECHGCSLEVVTRGPQCLIVCPMIQAVDENATTTLTRCAPPMPCTRTVNELEAPCGDCGVQKFEVTKTVDCEGCALSTMTIGHNEGVSMCACPTAPVTKTVEVCSVTESA